MILPSPAPAARAAIDMALYDLMAKHLNLPLVDVLGCAHRSLPTSITIGIESIRESLEEAQEYLRRGFRILKVKIGKSIEEDLERLHKLRENVGQKITIRVDINQGYYPGMAWLARLIDSKMIIRTRNYRYGVNIQYLPMPL